MAIDVGQTCTDGSGTSNVENCLVAKANPANAAGTIDYICIYCGAGDGMLNGKVGSFSASGDNLTTTDYVSVGDKAPDNPIEYNAPGEFTAFDINEGEYIGAYTDGAFRYASGDGSWYKAGDGFPYSNVAFTGSTFNRKIWGTGTEAGGAEFELLIGAGGMDGGFLGGGLNPMTG